VWDGFVALVTFVVGQQRRFEPGICTDLSADDADCADGQAEMTISQPAQNHTLQARGKSDPSS
jgi:hypothetical protein